LLYIKYIMTGIVKFFNAAKGYGFITNDATGQDIFVHATSLDGGSLIEGDKLEYVEEEGKKGKVAAQMQVYKKHFILVLKKHTSVVLFLSLVFKKTFHQGTRIFRQNTSLNFSFGVCLYTLRSKTAFEV
jgi:CspA family cold shock protein